MFNSPDYIYGIFLSGSYNNASAFFKALRKVNKEAFDKYSKFLFHQEFKEDLYKIVGETYSGRYLQAEIDTMCGVLANFCKQHISEEAKEFFKLRGISTESIESLQLGSTEAIDDKVLVEELIKSLSLSGVSRYIVEDLFSFFFTVLPTIKTLYGGSHFVTIPSYDVKGNCRGICFRTTRYKKLERVKNLYKFHFFNAPSYIFNEQVIVNNDIVFCFEGVFDSIIASQYGIDNTIALGNIRLSKWQYEKVKDRKVYYVFDNDLGGQNGLKSIEKIYADKDNLENYKGIVLPYKEDIDEMLLGGKEREVKEFLNSFIEIK